MLPLVSFRTMPFQIEFTTPGTQGFPLFSFRTNIARPPLLPNFIQTGITDVVDTDRPLPSIRICMEGKRLFFIFFHFDRF